VWEEQPWTGASSRAVREAAQENWSRYCSDGEQPTGHLLLYPYQVS